MTLEIGKQIKLSLFVCEMIVYLQMKNGNLFLKIENNFRAMIAKIIYRFKRM